MTGKEVSAIEIDPRRANAGGEFWYVLPSRPPLPGSGMEDDAMLPEDGDPWLEDEDPDDDGPEPKRPFWNR